MLLDKTRTVKIADFGVARVEASNPNDMTGETGTLGYMAPEVCSFYLLLLDNFLTLTSKPYKKLLINSSGTFACLFVLGEQKEILLCGWMSLIVQLMSPSISSLSNIKRGKFVFSLSLVTCRYPLSTMRILYWSSYFSYYSLLP